MKTKFGLKQGSFKVISLFLFVMGCSSAPKDPGALKGAATAESTSYVVTEHYPRSLPEWSEDFEKFKKSADGHGQTFYLGESGDVSDRIAGCELAGLTAKRKIAEQIAQMVTSRIGSGKAGVLQSDRDFQSGTGLGSDFQDLVAAESLAQLSGVQEYGKYWEERDYSASGGRKRIYQCQSVVSIDDAHLRQAIQQAGRATASSLSDPAAKSLVNAAFRKLERESESAKKAIQPVAEKAVVTEQVTEEN